ncbi:MAG: hypothetical protein R3F46_14995 [bacterium]|nr:hypothetical protein [bacterium]
MEYDIRQSLTTLEQRSRTLTALLMGLVAFCAAYALILLSGDTQRPAAHVWPWLLGVMFYLAGDVLGYIWFRVVSIHVIKVLRQWEEEQEKVVNMEDGLDAHELDDEVEVIVPNGMEE